MSDERVEGTEPMMFGWARMEIDYVDWVIRNEQCTQQDIDDLEPYAEEYGHDDGPRKIWQRLLVRGKVADARKKYRLDEGT